MGELVDRIARLRASGRRSGVAATIRAGLQTIPQSQFTIAELHAHLQGAGVQVTKRDIGQVLYRSWLPSIKHGRDRIWSK